MVVVEVIVWFTITSINSDLHWLKTQPRSLNLLQERQRYLIRKNNVILVKNSVCTCPYQQADGVVSCWMGADVVKSGVGFLVCTGVLLTWALMFAIGGDSLFGDSWRHLSVYDIADKYAPVW